MEKCNLKWDAESKRHELPFDIKELNDYSFLDSIYLGKEKQCAHKEPNASIDPDRATELVYKNKLIKEYANDFSTDIIFFVKQTLTSGVVMLIVLVNSMVD